MPAIAEHLRDAADVLHSAGISDPQREARSLLAFALRKDRTFLIAHPEYLLTDDEQYILDDVVARRASREPFQYITGVQEFYGLEFAVTPDVLIPRPETEMVVEAAIRYLAPIWNSTFCEVGVGSGCIAVSILDNVQGARGVALDVSAEAIAVANRNAKRLGVSDRIEFRRSDVFSALQDETFHLIASNPPYVPREDLAGLQEEVKDFEPLTALTDGSDGLSIIRRLVLESPNFLLPDGILLMEIGLSQSPAVEAMFDRKTWKSLEFLPDLQGIPRVVRANLR